MDLSIFKQENDLDKGLDISTCDKRILDMVKKHNQLNINVSNMIRNYIRYNANKIKDKLCNQYKFILEKQPKSFYCTEPPEVDIYKYTFQKDNFFCKIDIEIANFFGKLNKILLTTNNRSIEYFFVINLNDISQKYKQINWTITEYGFLTREDRAETENNKKYWNDELKQIEEDYNINQDIINQLKSLPDEEKYYITIEVHEGDKKDFHMIKTDLGEYVEYILSTL